MYRRALEGVSKGIKKSSPIKAAFLALKLYLYLTTFVEFFFHLDQHIVCHAGKIEFRSPAPFFAGASVVHAVWPAVGDGLFHRINLVIHLEVGEVLADFGAICSGSKLMDAMLKLFRCFNLLGSASINCTTAFKASGMYIMSM